MTTNNKELIPAISVISSLSTKEQVEEWRRKLEGFTTILNKAPKPEQVKKHKEGFQYMPIGVMETMADQLFFGLWQTTDFKYQVVANEIIGSITLEAFHPVAHTWIKRIGVGAVMIRQKSNSALTDIDSKYKNALVMDFPHLKAECFKNALMGFGNKFGRNLRRDFWEEYDSLYKEPKDPPYKSWSAQQTINKSDLEAMVFECNTQNEVLTLWHLLTQKQQSDKDIKTWFDVRKEQLKDEGIYA